jgi:hypothetical protein
VAKQELALERWIRHGNRLAMDHRLFAAGVKPGWISLDGPSPGGGGKKRLSFGGGGGHARGGQRISDFRA